MKKLNSLKVIPREGLTRKQQQQQQQQQQQHNGFSTMNNDMAEQITNNAQLVDVNVR